MFLAFFSSFMLFYFLSPSPCLLSCSALTISSRVIKNRVFTFSFQMAFHAFKRKFKSLCKNVWIFGSDDVRKHRKKAGNEFQGPSSKSWLQKKKSSKAETLYQRKDLCCHGDQAFLFPVNIYRLQDEPHPLLATASLSAIRQLLLSQFRPPTEVYHPHPAIRCYIRIGIYTCWSSNNKTLFLKSSKNNNTKKQSKTEVHKILKLLCDTIGDKC